MNKQKCIHFELVVNWYSFYSNNLFIIIYYIIIIYLFVYFFSLASWPLVLAVAVEIPKIGVINRPTD